jgi:NAD(P)H-quinone oxidoreductase subunit 5
MIYQRQDSHHAQFRISLMNNLNFLGPVLALVPFVLMLVSTAIVWYFRHREQRLWALVQGTCMLASLAAVVSLGLQLTQLQNPAGSAYTEKLPGGLAIGLLAAWLALLVQGLGTVIAGFSSRYLQGEPGQARYVAALSGVLAAVQLLLLADHWAVLISAWAGAGFALHRLLCFYSDRPFAALAAHKKFLADRLADGFLIGAAWLATHEVGSGSISALLRHVEVHGANANLQVCAILLALAVLIRTAMLPVHGWLIQVMEAPTPVSALLHAGVVNLGGYVLIRFAPLFESAAPARTMLVVVGLLTAVLAGFVMLTRISIKVRLAWSTLAQMGFMVLECGLGLYQLAALHLIGHSLYKAQAFLASGETVRQARLSDLRGPWSPAPWSLVLAPVLAVVLLGLLTQVAFTAAAPVWPWWWSAVLALAWTPMLWVRADVGGPSVVGHRMLTGSLLLALLTMLAFAGHALPLGVSTLPHAVPGQFVLAAMVLVYIGTAALQMPGWRQRLEPLRRQSYAGFYLDEAYTRLALRLWPVRLPATDQTRDANPALKAAPVQPASSL